MAKQDLIYNPVELSGLQARSVGVAFNDEIRKYGGVIWACAILATHVHLIIAPHRYDIRRFLGRLKGAATKQLKADHLYPPTFSGGAQHRGFSPTPWSRLPWIRYIWSEEDLLWDIQYVEENPLKEGKPPQTWNCVTSYVSQIRRAPHDR
jgi:REP element-mobilizing transposase RayT